MLLYISSIFFQLVYHFQSNFSMERLLKKSCISLRHERYIQNIRKSENEKQTEYVLRTRTLLNTFIFRAVYLFQTTRKERRRESEKEIDSQTDR